MPEEQTKINAEPTVDIPTEGDPVDVELKEDSSPKEQLTGQKPEVEVEVQQETSKEELDEYSTKVKGRINKLTGKLRETERREQASFDYAKRIQEENKKLRGRLNTLDTSYIDEYKARTEAETIGAKSQLQKAIEAGDVDAQVTAQEALSKLAVDNQRVLATTKAREQQIVGEEEKAYVPPKSPPKPDPKAEAWAGKNSWFGTDEAMTYASFGLHRKLVEEEGFNPKSDDYYTEIDKRIRQEFPHKFNEGGEINGSTKPVQSVASAGRTTTSKTSGRKTVRLTPSQVHIAKRLGVPLEEYAKYVKE